jgi:phosphate transport system protein
MASPHRMLSDEELVIHDNLTKMGHIASQELENAMTALMSQNASLAESVVKADNTLNALYRIVETECLNTLALRQPVASDLRDVVGSLQIARELERIGDHAKDIAKIVLSMDPSDFSGPMQQITEMGDLGNSMLGHAMEAVENKDADLARQVAADDKALDELDQETISSLMMTLMSAPDPSMRSTHLLWIAYHLERIGDHVTNVAERVVFIATSDSPDL